MLGADIILPKLERLKGGRLNNVLGARGHIGGADVALHTCARDLDDRVFQLFKIRAACFQNLCRNAVAFANKSQKNVLRADVGVSQLTRIGQGIVENILCFLCKTNGCHILSSLSLKISINT